MLDLQRTEQWHADRAGRITASRFVDVVAKTAAGKPKAERAKYMREVVFERLAAQAKHSVSSKSLNWGTEVEDFAIDAYELRTGLITARSPFVVHPRYDFIGASPDRLVGVDGGCEVKCPHDEGVHIETWLSGMPEDHIPQVQGGMLVTGRAWWDFISYDPRQGERFRLYVQRIERDQAYINSMLAELLQFNAEALKMQAELERIATEQEAHA